MTVSTFVETIQQDGPQVSEAFATAIAEHVDIAGVSNLVKDNVFLELAKSNEKVLQGKFLASIPMIIEKCGRSVEAIVAPTFVHILEATGHKDKAISGPAAEAVTAVVESFNAWALPSLVPAMIASGLSAKSKPGMKISTLNAISWLADNHENMVGSCLVDLVPAVSDQMWDIKKEVKNAAIEAMNKICKCTGNRDLVPFLPVVLGAIQNPKQIHEAVESLAGCVFVQNVEAPALAVTTPVLVRGLNERQEELKRKCCVIIDNMCKLVEEPKEVLPLLPKLLPLVQKNMDSISDPEARSIAEKAFKTLTKAGEGATSDPLTEEKCASLLKVILEKKAPAGAKEGPAFAAVVDHCARIALSLSTASHWDASAWEEAVSVPLLAFLPADAAKETAALLLQKCEVAGSSEDVDADEEDEGVDIYKGIFSLAYGSLTLLNNTKLNLKRNRFYGLLGPNNCGKTTLMRAIANEQVEGFPKRDELKTIFVEHEIQERVVGEDATGYDILNIDLNGIDWVVDTCNNVYKMETPVTKEQVAIVMEEIGFGNSEAGTGKDRAADACMGVTTYSGGWKMKMQLCAATLMDADILMLDEPTGHLDVKNIAWLQDWLQAFMDKGGSVIATSHDTNFLNVMCTHIIDFQDRKLKMFRGARGTVLSDWVAKYPEKKCYFELKNDAVKFVFPKPGPLDGVKSKTKAIMKMTDVTFQYPTRDTPTVFNIGLQVSQVSRVAVIGPNGAGKSTAIKLLNGELKPSQGIIWKHPNMRLAYVAQHAFHHLEKHMTKTPVQYIMWRFAGNDDKESLEFKTDVPLGEEDEQKQAVPWFLDPKQSFRLRRCDEKSQEQFAVKPETLLKRRENKKEKTKEYEVKWMLKPIDASTWVDRNTLIAMGYLKMVQRKDEQEAAASGLQTKPLTSAAIEKHLFDFGLDAESASHTFIQALSGGQKVKVVLAASMWQNPHLLILDEPTNYLDRDGLGALTHAIDAYEGGVIIISHNREFANAVSQEKWIMEAGHLRREGESVAKEGEDGQGNAEQEEVRDAAGNTINVNRQKALSDREKKAEVKKLEKNIKAWEKADKPQDEEYWEMKDRLAELKTELAK